MVCNMWLQMGYRNGVIEMNKDRRKAINTMIDNAQKIAGNIEDFKGQIEALETAISAMGTAIDALDGSYVDEVTGALGKATA